LRERGKLNFGREGRELVDRKRGCGYPPAYVITFLDIIEFVVLAKFMTIAAGGGVTLADKSSLGAFPLK